MATESLLDSNQGVFLNEIEADMTSPRRADWDPETVRKNAYKAVDWVVDYLSCGIAPRLF